VGEAGGRGRIVICDRDPRARRHLAAALAATGREIVNVGSGEEALAEAQRQRPDAVVLDVGAGGMSGYAVCRELRRRFGAALPILFVSGDRTDARDRVAGLLVGADDYLVKPVFPDELVLRIGRLLERGGVAAPRGSAELTPRELEVLQLLADGLTAPEIGRRLYISAKTVATHIQRILPKLGVHSRAQAVAHAFREGIVTN
jgi:DNA-binding NarL/FixJ family response regulator